MAERPRDAEQVLPELVGGALCLDVANSVDGRQLPVPDDYLTSYAEVVRWVERAGSLSAATADLLLTRADADPAAATDELTRVQALREAVFSAFYAHATDGVVDDRALAAIQAAYADALRHGRLMPGAPGLRWTWEPDLRLPSWLVAQSAIDLATSGSFGRVKACASQDGCQYLFVDTSKNGTRRWCSMSDCGNQAKSKRLTARRRATRTVGR